MKKCEFLAETEFQSEGNVPIVGNYCVLSTCSYMIHPVTRCKNCPLYKPRED